MFRPRISSLWASENGENGGRKTGMEKGRKRQGGCQETTVPGSPRKLPCAVNRLFSADRSVRATIEVAWPTWYSGNLVPKTISGP